MLPLCLAVTAWLRFWVSWLHRKRSNYLQTCPRVTM